MKELLGLGRRMLRRRPVFVTPRPKLSVVVPVYNVEQYLEACLDSLLAQPFADFEAILVDDGSTDASGEIVERYVSQHPDRFRVVVQDNAGLGAARNAGVRVARGEYLTFLDSDDELPADAYTAMVRTLEQSRSDFACGMLKRDEPERRFATIRMRDNHSRRRVGVTLDDTPGMLADVFAVNKVFRRNFWDRAGLAFPVDVRYEDQPTMTRAFIKAHAFDVLRETVYVWRVRHDGSSITQRRSDIDDLHDRIITKRLSTELVTRYAPHLDGFWRADILPVDMWEYFRSVPGCSDEYWSMLRAAVAEFWGNKHISFEHSRVPAQQRVMGWLVKHDRRTELERLVRFIDGQRGDLPVELRRDRVVVLLPGIDDANSEVPRELYELRHDEMRWETRITAGEWSEGRLLLRGFAFTRNVPTLGHDTSLTARLVGPLDATGEHLVVPVDVVARHQPRATRFANRPSQNFDACGFEAALSLSDLAEHSDTGTWRFVFERRVQEFADSGGVTSFDRPDVDLSWHEAETEELSIRARLRPVGEGLVLDLEATDRSTLRHGEPPVSVRAR